MARLTSVVSQFFKVPNDPDSTELKIKHLTPGEIQRIEADTSQWIGKNVDDRFTTELSYSPVIRMRKLRLAALVGWKGFYGIDGEALDCIPKHKETFLDQDPELGDGAEAKPLSAWIDEFREKLALTLKPEEEEAEKN